jgi:hypothetical protein
VEYREATLAVEGKQNRAARFPALAMSRMHAALPIPLPPQGPRTARRKECSLVGLEGQAVSPTRFSSQQQTGQGPRFTVRVGKPNGTGAERLLSERGIGIGEGTAMRL